MLMPVTRRTQGVMDVSDSSEKAIPAPTVFPAWNEATTKKILIPINTATGLPHRFRIVVNSDTSVASPIRIAMLTKTIIKKAAIPITHKKAFPYPAPSFEITVRLPGPKTSAAVINPGPK